ncbi:MAG TPA: AtpZ/AtpI family protein [Candidatus Saccharimonadales bacterium]|nr:AtpZ/AtpI family protein [Candidatus Saccharimonadales bacterium]
MSPATAPQSTPSKLSGTPKQPKVGTADSPTAVFIAMALDMSWRLALAILIPMIGGAELDKYAHTSPAFLIVGFVLAMLGMGLILWQTLQQANRLPVPKLSAAQKRAIKKQYEEDDD